MLFASFLLVFVAGANAAGKWYSIWPKDVMATDNNQKITNDLKSRIGNDNVHVSKSGLGNHYWYALLSDDDKQHYGGLDGVRYVALPETDTNSVSFSPLAKSGTLLQKRDPPVSQKPAPDHLKIISQAEGQVFKNLDGYYYDKSAGGGINIYVIDSGLNKHAAEFPSTEIHWLHAGPFADQSENDADPDHANGHGTCMASIALGKKDGVAKQATLTVVKADIFTNTDKVPDASAIAAERWIDALGETYDDIIRNNLKGKAVVSMSWGADKRKDKNYDDCIHDAFVTLFSALLKLDVPQVVAAGQNKGLPPPDVDPDAIQTYPALLGESDVKDMIVVASVDSSGRYEIGTRYSDYSIAAQGENSECAKSSGGDYHSEDGTSPATAAVAGLLSYYMALGKSGADLRQQLFDKAYPRVRNGPKVVWNLIDTRPSTPGVGSSSDSKKCHGVNGQQWIISRDQAVSAAKDFCGQNDTPKEYYQGTANDLELSLTNKLDQTKPISAVPNCADTFIQAVIDGCDGNDPTNNPHDYKFGGVYTTSDGWEFTLTPKATQVDEDSCDVSYQFFDDYFEVRGKNFPDAKLGANGEGLKSQISGCGKLTDWEFKWTPNDVKYQWYAHGKLPIGTKSCVGSATQSAGGSSSGNCHGAG